MGFTAKKTYCKFFDTQKKEKEAAEAAELGITGTGMASSKNGDTASVSKGKSSTGEESSDEEIAQDDPLLPPNGRPVETDTSEQTTSQNTVVSAESKARCKTLLEEDSRQYPAEKLGALVVLWIGLVLLTFFKGGKGVDSIIGITCASCLLYTSPSPRD